MADTDFPLLVFSRSRFLLIAQDDSEAVANSEFLIQRDKRNGWYLSSSACRRRWKKRRLTLQDNPFGLLPEQVLVLETIGTIDNFVRAVEKIPGLEWLAEYELDDIAPEHGFEDEEKADKHLKGQLFLVLTEQQALSQLQGLFDLWRSDRNAAFPYGLAPLRHAFRYLHTIRPWDVEDRIRETGILEGLAGSHRA